MPRRVSFLVLLVAVLAFGTLFFRIVRPFLVPLLCAAVLAMLFYPVQTWLAARMRGYRRVSAGLATAGITLLVFVPIVGALIGGGAQLLEVGEDVLEKLESSPSEEAPAWRRWWESATASLSATQRQWLRQGLSRGVDGLTTEVYAGTQSLLADAFGFAVGAAVMVLALYYFLAEGPELLQRMRALSPLEERDMDVLYSQFDKVCRGVVLGTLVAAMAQGVLAGLGFWALGVGGALLLALATMFFAMIPFLGAAVVYLVVAVVLFFVDDRHAAAIGLAVYGVAVVSTADNLIKAYAVRGSARLHPLIVLVTMLGALRVIGLWGLFLGPLIAAFFYSLVKILHERAADADASLAENQTEEEPSGPADDRDAEGGAKTRTQEAGEAIQKVR